MPGFTMKTTHQLARIVLGLICLTQAEAGNWPGWRGPTGNGISPEKGLPVKWSATENVRWKIELPGRGNSSAIVWENRVFLTQSLEAENRRTVVCYDRKTGKKLWQAGPVYTEKETTHDTNPFCSASPTTDGQRVIAWFGSAGIYCYDMEGKELWHRDLGKQSHGFGYGASPVIWGDLCILNFGPGDRSFITGLDKKTGQAVWQNDITKPVLEYEGPFGTYSTPVLVGEKGKEILVTTYPKRVVGLDPKTGKELWSCGGLDQQVISSPVPGDGVVVAMGGFKGNSVAVKLGGEKDVTESHRLWQNKTTFYTSGVIHEGHLYTMKTAGIAVCVDLQTGKPVWEERLASAEANNNTWSSMVLSDGKLYVPNQSGVTFVLKASPKFELLATNSIGGELNNSSLALANGDVLMRTHKHLWCFGL